MGPEKGRCLDIGLSERSLRLRTEEGLGTRLLGRREGHEGTYPTTKKNQLTIPPVVELCVEVGSRCILELYYIRR